MKYLYVIHINVYGEGDRIYMERSAALDLQAHQRLLPSDVMLVLAAPFTELNSAKVAKASLEEIQGVEYFPLKFVDSIVDGFRFSLHNWRKLTKAVASAKFIHTGCGGFPFFFSPCYFAYLLALKMKKKVIFVMDCDLVGKLETNQVNLTENFIKKTIWYLFSRLCWHMYKRCLSKASATFLLGRGVVSRYSRYAKNWLEIYQPIVGRDMIIPTADLQEKIQNLQDQKRLNICFAGRLAPEKGVEVMLRALTRLPKKIPFSVNIYGDGPYRACYMELADQLGLKEVTVFHGNLQWGAELFGELRKNHILIVPHLTLEMTRNVFDGMASGCTIIASSTEALERLMNDAHAGMLFETGNHEELALVLEEQFSRPEMLIKSILNGINFVKRNNRDSHIRRRLQFLQKRLALPQ